MSNYLRAFYSKTVNSIQSAMNFNDLPKPVPTKKPEHMAQDLKKDKENEEEDVSYISIGIFTYIFRQFDPKI